MTEKDFLTFHTGYYGEEISSLKQIKLITFDGDELFEYIEALTKELSIKLDKSERDLKFWKGIAKNLRRINENKD